MPNFNKTDLLYAALKGCIDVMERDLNGLAVIQPELKQAKQAIDQFELVDSDADAVEWIEESLPMIGKVCEHFGTDTHTNWIEVKIIGHGHVRNHDVAFFEYMDHEKAGKGVNGYTVSYSSANNFRPLQEPEAIAAAEREKWSEHFGGRLYGMCMERRIGMNINAARELARDIYDAGYRKQVSE